MENRRSTDARLEIFQLLVMIGKSSCHLHINLYMMLSSYGGVVISSFDQYWRNGFYSALQLDNELI